MNAFVQLALIEKAKRVFATGEGVMLSFPLLSPIVFTAAELNSLSNLPETADDYAAAADFARSVNFIPRDLVASASELMLWDIYRDVLSRAEVAISDSVGSVITAPNALLYTMTDEGARVESEALKLYRQYRDAWFQASEDYAAHKLSGELNTDPTVQQHWRNFEEPALRAALEDVKRDWQILGRQEDIERALAAEKAAAIRSPVLRWAEWAEAFNPDIDLITDAGGSRYAPTGLSPRNFAEQEGWLSFDLSASEMAALVAEAPDELKAVLDDSGRGAVEKVSFEYRSVALVRSWFRPEALTSQIWRSAEMDLQLSGGGEPATGTCPAYATACVFVRNVVIVESGVSQPTPPHTGLFNLNAQLLTKRAVVADPALLARLVRRRDQIAAEPAPQPISMRAFRALDQNSVSTLARPARGLTEHFAMAEIVRAPAIATSLSGRGRFFDIVTMPDLVSTTEPPPPSPTPAPPRDEISVLAFICKRIPKAPNPAAELKWA